MTIYAEEVQVPRLWMQAHAAALLRWVTPVGARNDGPIDYLAGARDSAIQVGVCPELLNYVDLHLDTEAAQLEVFGTDPNDDLARVVHDLARQANRPITQRYRGVHDR